MKKILLAITALFLALALVACGSIPASNAPPQTSPSAITLHVFTNNPDRTRDQGLVEQMLFNAYMAENENVSIVVEALEDDPYKVKFKAYCAGSDMPDLVSVWGQPGFIDEVIDGGVLAQLNPGDYANYGFVQGALDGFSRNGKLYGLPRTTDVMVCYYNKNLFAENHWAVPATFDEFTQLAQAAKNSEKLGVAVDGMGAWSLTIYLTDLLAKFNGAGVQEKIRSAINSGNWEDPIFTQAAKLMQNTSEAIFMEGFESTDYDTAKNLFLSGQAAIAYLGSWEMAMASEADFEVGAFTLPAVQGGAGAATDIAAWTGGGYSVPETSKNKEEAIKLLNYMLRPENWTRLCWENSVCMTAQDFREYSTGNETPVQREIMALYMGASSITGTPLNDMGTSQFKTNSEAAVLGLATNTISVADFYAALIR